MDLFDAGSTRGRGSYANPNDTIAVRDTPVNLKQIMRLTRWYYIHDSLLHAICNKMAEYPITDIVIKEVDPERDPLSRGAQAKWDTLLNVVLDLRRVMIQQNTDKKVYGVSAWYIYYPFVRYCICDSCGKRSPIATFQKLRARQGMEQKKFTLTIIAECADCKQERNHKIDDRKSEAVEKGGMNLVRLDPLRMEQEYNPVTGARRWYWTPPRRLQEGIATGDRTVIDTTELGVLEAVFKNEKIWMNKDRLFVAMADGHPGLWEGWAMPPLFPVLEDVYYYKMLRRANEALAHEHVTPLRIVSPMGTGDVSPQRTMNLTDWQTRIKNELYKFKRDPNHILVSPLPINVEQIGGQARVMMVSSEMEAAARVIACGVGCPIEMIWGGLNWSGASVSLRVLENHFINERQDSERMLKFLVPKLGKYFRLPRISATLSDFKMADDAARVANLINLMLQGFLSREDVLPDLGFKPNLTFEKLKSEHKALNSITSADNIEASHLNSLVQTLEAKAQILLQFELQHLQQDIAAQSERERLQKLQSHVMELHQKGFTSPIEFDQSAQVLSRMDPNISNVILSTWMQTMPNLTSLLTEKMRVLGTAQQNQQLAMQAAGGGPAGMQSAGAAAGPGMAPGAVGPYGSGGAGGGQMADPGQAAPVQRPSNTPGNG